VSETASPRRVVARPRGVRVAIGGVNGSPEETEARPPRETTREAAVAAVRVGRTLRW